MCIRGKKTQQGILLSFFEGCLYESHSFCYLFEQLACVIDHKHIKILNSQLAISLKSQLQFRVSS